MIRRTGADKQILVADKLLLRKPADKSIDQLKCKRRIESDGYWILPLCAAERVRPID
jgi:hypothetical protein